MRRPTVVGYLRKKPTPSYTSSCVGSFWTFLDHGAIFPWDTLWPVVLTWLSLLNCCTLNCKINTKTLTLEWWVRDFSQRQQAAVLWQALDLIYHLFISLKTHLHLSFSPHSPGIYCCNWVPAAHVSGVVTGKAMSRYTNNAVSSPKYWVPLRTEWREKAIYGDCNLGYFHCWVWMLPWSLRLFILSGFWEREGIVPATKSKGVYLGFLWFLLMCVCILRWKGLRNLWGNLTQNITLYKGAQTRIETFIIFFLNRINFFKKLKQLCGDFNIIALSSPEYWDGISQYRVCV